MRKLMAAKLLSLCLIGTAHADQWTFFHPEAVTKLTYRVIVIDLQEGNSRSEHYICDVHAERDDPALGAFDFTAGYFPPTAKGRHEAEKACSKWMDEAQKRVARARRIK